MFFALLLVSKTVWCWNTLEMLVFKSEDGSGVSDVWAWETVLVRGKRQSCDLFPEPWTESNKILLVENQIKVMGKWLCAHYAVPVLRELIYLSPWMIIFPLWFFHNLHKCFSMKWWASNHIGCCGLYSEGGRWYYKISIWRTLRTKSKLNVLKVNTTISWEKFQITYVDTLSSRKWNKTSYPSQCELYIVTSFKEYIMKEWQKVTLK